MSRAMPSAVLVAAILVLGAVEVSTADPPAAQGAAAEQTGPVTLDGIRQMRKERMNAKQIVAAIEQRGLGFPVDPEAERRLRSMGFNPKIVAQLKGMRSVDTTAAAPPLKDAAGAPLAADAARPAAAAHRVLDPATENDYKATAERVAKTVASSGTGVSAHPTAHINLLANSKVAEKLRGDVEQLEKLLAQEFPEPIASGVDGRAANIVLLENRYEYEAWMRALFKVHEQSGLKFQGDDPLKSALATNAVFIPGVFSVCLEGIDGEGMRRRLAFAVGYHYMRQLTGDKAPDFLQTGFGNYTEALMFKEPVTTVVSGYTDRQLNAQRARWIDMVRQRINERKTPSLANMLNYSTQSMSMDQYAESWTMATLLATDSRKFGELVTRLNKGDPAAATITEIYGMKDDALMKHWSRFVLGGR